MIACQTALRVRSHLIYIMQENLCDMVSVKSFAPVRALHPPIHESIAWRETHTGTAVWTF